MTSENSQLIVRNEAILSSEVGDDIVALNVSRGECFGMEEVTAEIWRLLAKPMTVISLCQLLVERYEVTMETCYRDVAAMIGEMREKGLVLNAPAGA